MKARLHLIMLIVVASLVISLTGPAQPAQGSSPPPYTAVFNVVNDRVSVKTIHEGRTVREHQLRLTAKQMEQLVGNFYSAFEAKDGLSPEFLKRFDPELAKSLYRELLSQALENVPQGADLRIVPDYSLGGIPFEALVVEGTPEWKDDSGRVSLSGLIYLHDRYNIRYGRPACSKLESAARREQATEGRILVVADPVFDAEDPRIRDAARDRRRPIFLDMPDRLMGTAAVNSLFFPRLPLTAELASQIKVLYPDRSDVLTGIVASKTAFVGLGLSRYSTLVFATHGHSGQDLPAINEPIMVLSLVDQPEGQDGFCRASEVAQLKLNADLVALFVSQSGLGKHVPGKGLESIGNAFLDAGARSVLVMLWSGSETASMKVGEYFFQNLKAGKDKAEALRSAKGELRRAGFDHPFYWAGGVLVNSDQDLGDQRVTFPAQTRPLSDPTYSGNARLAGTGPEQGKFYKSFVARFPSFGREEFALAHDKLFPDWKKRFFSNGTWFDFLLVYQDFVKWWKETASTRQPGLELWNEFMKVRYPSSFWTFASFKESLFTAARLAALLAIPGLWLFYLGTIGRSRRRPFRNVVRVFFCGCGVTLLSAVIDLALSKAFPHQDHLIGHVAWAFMIAISTQSSLFLVVWLAVYRNAKFRAPIDGVVYAATAAVGLATLEHVVYILAWGWHILFSRVFLVTPAHMLFAAMWGSAMGQVCFKKEKEFLTLLKGLAASVLLQGIYNSIIAVNPKNATWWLIPFLIFMALLLYRRVWNLYASHLLPRIRDGELVHCYLCGACVMEGETVCSRCGESLAEIDNPPRTVA